MNSKVTDLSSISALDSDDLFMVVDVSDTSMAGTGTNKKIKTKNVIPYFYIPSTGDTTDRQANIQAAMDIAESLGGGVVELGPGDFRVTTINSPSGPNKSGGAYGLEIPDKVTLKGQGVCTTLTFVAGGSFGTGACIAPKGFRTATVSYGASKDVTIEKMKLQTLDGSAPSTGNLISLCSGERWLIREIEFGTSYYHALEINLSRKVKVIDCRFTGAHAYASSGSWIQLDNGDGGPRSTLPASTTEISDILFLRCEGLARPDTDTAQRDIDLFHADINVRKVLFDQCRFEGRALAFTNIADVAVTLVTGYCKDLVFRNTEFITNHSDAYAFYLNQNGGGTFRNISFEGCSFSGKSATALLLSAGSAAAYTSPERRRDFRVTNCNFEWDKTSMTVGRDFFLVQAYGIDNFVFTGNRVVTSGDFPALAVGLSLSALIRIHNCIKLTVCDNNIQWQGNGMTVSTTLLYIDYTQLDSAGVAYNYEVNDNAFLAPNSILNYFLLITGGTPPTTSKYRSQNNKYSGTAISRDLYSLRPTLHESASLVLSSQSLSANYTLNLNDCIIYMDATAGNRTVTLPSGGAGFYNGKTYIVKKTDASANTVTVNGATISAQNGTVMVNSTGSSWINTTLA